MMIERSGEIIWCNDAAHLLFDAELGFIRRGETLFFLLPENDRRFQDYLQTLGPHPNTLVLRQTNAHGWVMFDACIVTDDRRDVACVVMRVDGTGIPQRYHDLGKIFSLTPAEHRVVLDMLDGRRADLIAAALGVSVGTIRTHVRRIYQKLGVSSREQLLSTFQPYQID